MFYAQYRRAFIYNVGNPSLASVLTDDDKGGTL